MSRFQFLVVASALVFTTACVADAPAPISTDGGAIRFSTLEISAQSRSCADDESKCARITLRSLETTGGGTKIARDNIDLYLIHDRVSRMRALLPENVGNPLNNADELAAAFLAEHRTFVEDFPDATAAWSVEITASAITSTPAVATIEIREIAYTGGAHPNTRRRLVSFDVESGQLLGIDDLTTDTEALRSLVETQFRIERDLGPDDDLAAAGFWFPETGFTLPDNLGILSDGIIFHWDAYEIAPYSMGPVDVTVPVADLHGIVDRDYW